MDVAAKPSTLTGAQLRQDLQNLSLSPVKTREESEADVESERSDSTTQDECSSTEQQGLHLYTNGATSPTASTTNHPGAVCEIEARTRPRTPSEEEVVTKVKLEVTPGAELSIGQSDSCSVTLTDGRCEKVHAVVGCRSVGGRQGVYLVPKARTHSLVGKRQRGGGKRVLRVGSVFKVGAISMKVTNLCTSISEAFDTVTHADTTTGSVSSGSCTGAEESEESCQLDSEAVCYICFLREGQSPVKPECDKDVRNSPGEERGAKKTILQRNPLLCSPCGNRKKGCGHVHLRCLLKWIEKSGKEKCMCGATFPPHFISAPPCLELKVVRHRWPYSFMGKRLFRLSFLQTDKVGVGKMSSAEVLLPEKTVDDIHAWIKFDRERKQFFLEDNDSSSGTYIQVSEPQCLLPNDSVDTPLDFMVGRTTLSMKLLPKTSEQERR